LILHYLLQSRGVLTVLLYIFIKQRHVQTFWGIIHVCQAILETGSGRKLSHNGCTTGNLTYPTMVFYFLLGPQVLWNDLRGIFIKQRHVQTFWGIIHVCQAILETGSGRKLSHNGCTGAILTYPTMVLYLWLGPQVLWNDLRGIVIKQRHWQTFWGIIHVDQVAYYGAKMGCQDSDGYSG
jgi:hypothetical protein